MEESFAMSNSCLDFAVGVLETSPELYHIYEVGRVDLLDHAWIFFEAGHFSMARTRIS